MGQTATQARHPTHSFLSSITTPWDETVRACTGHSATQSLQVWSQTVIFEPLSEGVTEMHDLAGSSTLKNRVEQAVMQAPHPMHFELSLASLLTDGTAYLRSRGDSAPEAMMVWTEGAEPCGRGVFRPTAPLPLYRIKPSFRRRMWQYCRVVSRTVRYGDGHGGAGGIVAGRLED